MVFYNSHEHISYWLVVEGEYGYQLSPSYCTLSTCSSGPLFVTQFDVLRLVREHSPKSVMLRDRNNARTGLDVPSGSLGNPM